jgi:secreted trypsin-like serine protease
MRRVRSRSPKAEYDREARDLIIGGHEAPDDEYSYGQISLRYNDRHLCGGSLITRDMILTAGHCLKHHTGNLHIGRYDFGDSDERIAEYEMQEFFIHPNFDPDTYRYDFAIIRLDRQVNDTTIFPIRLNKNSSFPLLDTNLAILGWGATSIVDERTYPDVFQIGYIKALSNTQCSETTYSGRLAYYGEVSCVVSCPFCIWLTCWSLDP